MSMMIHELTTMNELKQHMTFSMLQKVQNRMDAVDPALGGFTRSHWHIMAFLVTYAGLNPAQKAQVVAQLHDLIRDHSPFELEQLTQDNLDRLVNQEMNWEQLLAARQEESTIDFTFTIELISPEALQRGLLEHCPKLAGLDLSRQKLLTVIQGSDPNLIKLTTKVMQTEFWPTAFTVFKHQPHDLDEFWLQQDVVEGEHSCFEISPALKQKIAAVSSGQELDLGAFSITKVSDDNQITLVLKAQKYKVKKEGTVNPGIYQAFLALRGVYGLSFVETVKVSLENKACFRKDGASAKSEQRVDLRARGIGASPYTASKGITIYINQLSTFFEGMDMGVQFGTPFSKVSRQAALDDYSIRMISNSKEGTTVHILAQAYRAPGLELGTGVPEEVHEEEIAAAQKPINTNVNSVISNEEKVIHASAPSISTIPARAPAHKTEMATLKQSAPLPSIPTTINWFFRLRALCVAACIAGTALTVLAMALSLAPAIVTVGTGVAVSGIVGFGLLSFFRASAPADERPIYPMQSM